MLQKKRGNLLNIISIFIASIVLLINFRGLKVSAGVEKYTLDNIFISEKSYNEKLEEEVIPYLSSVMREGSISGEDDVELYYRKYTANESKGTIVISHGFGEFIEIYNELIYYFNKSGYNVFMMEHRGHGRSGHLGVEDKTQIHVENFNDYVVDFKKFIDEVVIKESKDDDLFLFAHSMGGAIGSTFLIDYPGYFDAVILNSPMMTIHTGSIPLFVADIIASTADFVGLGGKYVPGKTSYSTFLIEESGTGCEERFNYTRDAAEANEEVRRGGPSLSWLNNSIDIGKYITKKENASKVEVPVMLFKAEKDDYVKEKGQNNFAKYAKDCKLVTVEDAKHESYKEKDDICREVIEEYIDFYNSKNVK